MHIGTTAFISRESEYSHVALVNLSVLSSRQGSKPPSTGALPGQVVSTFSDITLRKLPNSLSRGIDPGCRIHDAQRIA